MSKEGVLLLGTDAGKRELYYQLVGGYLVQFNDPNLRRGTPFLPTYVQGIEDILRAATELENPQVLSPQFIARIESQGARFDVYTPTRTLHLYALSLDEQKSWIAALTASLEERFGRDELEAKRTAEAKLRPLMLRQEYTEFVRFSSIVSSMVGAGMMEKQQIVSLKKGYLQFQRLEYEDEQFYADLMPDAERTEARFTKAYCLLRSDMTLVYGANEKEAKTHPEGVVSLAHLHVELDHAQIEETGKMIFSLVTPMRTFVLSAPHQVALEEWLRAIVKVSKGQMAGNAGAVLSELATLRPSDVLDVDLHTILDTEPGVEAYANFLAGLDDVTRDVFACWRLTKEIKDLSEFEDESDEHKAQCDQLLTAIVDGYLGRDSSLPADIVSEDIRDEAKATFDRDDTPSVNALRAACLKYLHDATYKKFQKSDYYQSLMAQLAEANDDPPRDRIPEEATRLLVHAPLDPAEFKKRLKTNKHTRLMAVGTDANGTKLYEAWTTIPYVKGETTEITIGRDANTDLTIDEDKKLSREHARIDCQPDGECLFLDLGSSYGSKVNGKCVSGRVHLAVGDTIKLGKTRLLFTIIPQGQDEPLN